MYVKSNTKGSVLAVSSHCSSLDTSTSELSGIQVSTQGTEFLDSLMKDLKQYKAVSGGVDARTELDILVKKLRMTLKNLTSCFGGK